ncbi:MAG: terminase family protein [Clostridia bacterium]
MIKEKLLKLKSINEEIQNRKNSPLCNYNKVVIHKKQMEFHKCLKQNRWVFGGNRTGKTECGAVETVWLARGIHPYRQNRANVSCFVVSLSTEVQRDVAQEKILKYLDKRYIIEVVMNQGRRGSMENGIIDYLLVKNEVGGVSKVSFKSCEMGREKFSGASLDFVWFDEEPPYDIYCECKMRLLDRRGIMFGTMTPLKGLSWVYEEIFLNSSDDKEVWSQTMEWADNPYLNKDETAYYTQTLSEESLKTRRYGQFFTGSGLVYSEFDPNIHVIKPFAVPYIWYDKLSIDPGLNNPLSCHWYAVDGDGVVYVIAEHYEAKKDVSYHAEVIKKISNQLGWQTDKGKICALIDSAANQHTLASNKSVAELFWEQGIAVSTNVNKDLFSGINRVKGALKPLEGKPKLYIFENCVNLIKEMRGYWWGSNDRPKKVDDHALDELRYYISSRPEPYTPKLEEQSLIAKDKAKLAKRLQRNRFNKF